MVVDTRTICSGASTPTALGGRFSFQASPLGSIAGQASCYKDLVRRSAARVNRSAHQPRPDRSRTRPCQADQGCRFTTRVAAGLPCDRARRARLVTLGKLSPPWLWIHGLPASGASTPTALGGRFSFQASPMGSIAGQASCYKDLVRSSAAGQSISASTPTGPPSNSSMASSKAPQKYCTEARSQRICKAGNA